MKTIIKSPSSAYIELSVFHALIRLNTKEHLIGEPDVVVYRTGDGKLNSIFTVGVKNDSGPDSYRVLAVGETRLIWAVESTKHTVNPGEAYIYKSSSSYFLEEPNKETPLKEIGPTIFYNVSTGEILVNSDSGVLRGIYDFYTKTEIDSSLGDATDELVRSNWDETSPLSPAYIKNKPTSFSGFQDDITFEILENEEPETGFYKTYQLYKNGEALGDPINLPYDLLLKSGSIIQNQDDDLYYLDLVVGKVGDSDSDTHIYVLLDALLDIYTSGSGISVNEETRTISAKIHTQNGLSLSTSGFLVSLASESNSGAMSGELKEKLDGIDFTDYARTSDLLSGDLKVKVVKETKGIISQSTDRLDSKSQGFTFRSTAGDISVGSGEAIIEKIYGTSETPFNPGTLKSVGNNAADISKRRDGYKLGYNKLVQTDINYSLVWFKCIPGELSITTAELKNNGYAITSDSDLGVVGFTTSVPGNGMTAVEEILNPSSTPFNPDYIHYIPPTYGWIVVSVKTNSLSSLCARLSWSGAYDRVFEDYNESIVTLKTTPSNIWGAFSKTILNKTISDYWENNNDTLTFNQYYGRQIMESGDWGQMRTETHSLTDIVLIYQGSVSSTPILYTGARLPDTMTVDGSSVSPSLTYTFGDTNRHEVRMVYSNLSELPGQTFQGITSLVYASLPDSIESVGFDCFKDCTNLGRIIFGTNTNYIGAGCCSGCENLTTITSLSNNPPTIFQNTFPSPGSIYYVPGNYISFYREADIWDTFSLLPNPNANRQYYQYKALQGIIKESSEFIYGLGDGVFVTELGYLEFNTDGTILPPTGTLYYELKSPVSYDTGFSSHYIVGDCGTEEFQTNNPSGPIEIHYPVNLYDDLRHSGEMLDEKLEQEDIKDNINTEGAVQNKVVKEYIDLVVKEASNTILKDLSRRDSFGNVLETRNTANSYIIKEPGYYRIPLVYGNAIKNGEPNPSSYSGVTSETTTPFLNYLGNEVVYPYIETDTQTQALFASIVWQDKSGMIKNVSLSHGNPCRFINFYLSEVPETGGNAVICIKDSSQNIMWSWHIWVFSDDITPVSIWNSIANGQTSGTEYKIMPYNLGTSWDDSGKTHLKSVFYQWGRKDPIPGPASYNSGNNPTLYDGTYDYSGSSSSLILGIKNPGTFYTDWSGSYNLWNYKCSTSESGGDINPGKTIYDPCPYGWKVPGGGIFRGFTTTRDNVSQAAQGNVIGSFSSGWYFKAETSDTTGLYFPASGQRTGSLSGVGSVGNYWTTSPGIYNDSAYRFGLGFDSSSISPLQYYNTIPGNCVRPVID